MVNLLKIAKRMEDFSNVAFKGKGSCKKKKSIFEDIIQEGGWVVKAFSKFF